MKIVILGAGGRLGAALLRDYRDKFEVAGFNHAQLELADVDGVRTKLRSTDFDVLINAAAFTNVDLCETQRDLAFLINSEAPRVLAKICQDKGAKLIHFSTDYVFDGVKREPYTESDSANPISIYGESKRAGEENILAVGDRHLVVRVSWIFGPDRPSFIDAIIKRAQENEQVDAVADKFSAPTYARDVAEMLPSFFARAAVGGGGDSGHKAARDYGGILHFTNAGECSWQEYAQWALDCCQELGVSVQARTVSALELKDMKNWVARRPVYSVLSSGNYAQLTGVSPRTWREAVSDYIRRFYSKK